MRTLAQLGVLQFSNNVQEEVKMCSDEGGAPQPFDATAFSTAVAAMRRLNGGTNIAAALRCAKARFAKRAMQARH